MAAEALAALAAAEEGPRVEIRLHAPTRWPPALQPDPAPPPRRTQPEPPRSAERAPHEVHAVRHAERPNQPSSPPGEQPAERPDEQIGTVLQTMALSTVDLQLASMKVANLARMLGAGESVALRQANAQLEKRNMDLAAKNKELASKADAGHDLRQRNLGLESDARRLQSENELMKETIRTLQTDLAQSNKQRSHLLGELSEASDALARHASLDRRTSELEQLEKRLVRARVSVDGALAAERERAVSEWSRRESELVQASAAAQDAAVRAAHASHIEVETELRAQLAAADGLAARELAAALAAASARHGEERATWQGELRALQSELDAQRESAIAQREAAVTNATSELQQQLVAARAQVAAESASAAAQLAKLASSSDEIRSHLVAEGQAELERQLRVAAERREDLVIETARERERAEERWRAAEEELRARFQREREALETEVARLRAELRELRRELWREGGRVENAREVQKEGVRRLVRREESRGEDCRDTDSMPVQGDEGSRSLRRELGAENERSQGTHNGEPRARWVAARAEPRSMSEQSGEAPRPRRMRWAAEAEVTAVVPDGVSHREGLLQEARLEAQTAVAGEVRGEGMQVKIAVADGDGEDAIDERVGRQEGVLESVKDAVEGVVEESAVEETGGGLIESAVVVDGVDEKQEVDFNKPNSGVVSTRGGVSSQHARRASAQDFLDSLALKEEKVQTDAEARRRGRW